MRAARDRRRVTAALTRAAPRPPVRRGILAARFVDSPASEQPADYAADQSTWTATAAMTMSTAPAAMMGRMLVIGFTAAAEIGVRR